MIPGALRDAAVLGEVEPPSSLPPHTGQGKFILSFLSHSLFLRGIRKPSLLPPPKKFSLLLDVGRQVLVLPLLSYNGQPSARARFKMWKLRWRDLKQFFGETYSGQMAG